MKNIALILLVTIYSLATLGLSLKGSYCCGNLTSVSLSLTGSQNQKPKEDNKSDCCKTSYQFFKVNEKHIMADEISSPANHSALLHLFTSSSYCSSKLPDQSQDINNSSHAPPLYNGVPLYLSNCLFRI